MRNADLTARLARRLFSLVAASVLCTALSLPAEAQVTADHRDITYIVPVYLGYQSVTDDEFKIEVQRLRDRIGEGPYVRVGFSVYVYVTMDAWSVDVTDPATVRASLSGTIDQIDRAITRARANDIPICLNTQWAIRGAYDAVQLGAERADRRNSQWLADNSLASGWMTYSRYARHMRAVQEAYVRELGKIIANRMHEYPDTVVAAAGDGELEMSYDKTPIVNSGYTIDTMLLADYSPFAIAEFRDWLTHRRLYAPGQAFAGQGYAEGERYRGDATPGEDTNGDGHWLNHDFGTNFETWDLLYYDWTLDRETETAIPAAVYNAGDWDPRLVAHEDGFDAPRVRAPSDAWWRLWLLWRQTILWRHNLDFSRWMTTAEDPVTHATIPATRWFSYQIPADYLFGASPENPNLRFETSASAWWTGDVSPYGGIGITSFNTYDGVMHRTFAAVAPHIAERDLRIAILEWNPYVAANPDTSVYDDEMRLIEQYRPAVLAPFALDYPAAPFLDTPFETALRALVDRIKNGSNAQPLMAIDTPAAASSLRQPFLVGGWALDLGTIRGSGRGSSGVTSVDVYATRSGATGPVLLGSAGYGTARPDVGGVFGTQFTNSGFNFIVRGLAAGTYDIELRAHSRGVSTEAVNVRHVTVTIGSTTEMSIDAPREGATLHQPFLLAGWALDFGAAAGTGVDTLHAYAYPETGDPIFLGVVSYGLSRPDVGAAFGGQFANSGWGLTVSGLQPGRYRLVVYAHNVQSWSFEKVLVVGVTVESGAVMNLDAPAVDSAVSGSFVVAGWALELGSATGAGVDAIHAWAFPTNGQAPTFLGAAALDVARPDVAAAFGAQFVNSGFSFVAPPLAPGDYWVAVYAHSAVTGTFNNTRAVHLSVQ
jgi:hypothetical protein